MCDDLRFLAQALSEEKSTFEEHTLQAHAAHEELKIRLAASVEEAVELHSLNDSLTNELEVQTEELAAYKREIYEAQDACSLLQDKLDVAHVDAEQHKHFQRQLNAHLQDVEDRMEQARVDNKHLTLRNLLKVRRDALLHALLSFKHATNLRNTVDTSCNKALDLATRTFTHHAGLRPAFAGFVAAVRQVAMVRKAVESAVGKRGLGRVRRRRYVRLRFFAAWRTGAHLARYSAIQSVHSMTLHRLLEHTHQASPETSFTSMTAINGTETRFGIRGTLLPKAHKVRQPQPRTRDSMTIYDPVKNVSDHERMLMSASAHDSASDNDSDKSSEMSNHSDTDDIITMSPTKHHREISQSKLHDKHAPASPPHTSPHSHRATQRVLHTQLATAQVCVLKMYAS